MDEKEFFAKLAAVGPDGKFEGVDLKVKQNGKSRNGNPKIETERNSGMKEAEEKKSEEIEIFEEPQGQLAIDVYSTPTSFVVESAVAGVKGEDIDISITPDSVTIKGKRIKENVEKGNDYLYQECFWGRFSRSVILPEEIDAERSHASFKNGVLRIVLPKLSRQKERKLKVRFD